MLERERVAAVGHKVQRFLLVIAVPFDQVAVVIGVQPVFGNFHVFAEQVVALVTPVQEQFHEFGAGRPRHRHQLAQFECDAGAQQRFVAVVGQQYPLFVGRHTQNLGFFVQLDLVRLFRIPERGVAPAPDTHGAFVSGFEIGGFANRQRSVDVVLFRRDCRTLVGFDRNDRQTGEIEQVDFVFGGRSLAVRNRIDDLFREVVRRDARLLRNLADGDPVETAQEGRNEFVDVRHVGYQARNRCSVDRAFDIRQ